MALLGQMGFGNVLARALGFLPSPRPPVLAVHFKPHSFLQSDVVAHGQATAYYSGAKPISDGDYASLRWLECFAQSGRQLLMCHALRLLGSWTKLNRPLTTIALEADVLHRLTVASGAFAQQLQQQQLQPLADGLALQLRRLQKLRPHNASEALDKAMVLLQAARAVQEGAFLRNEAMETLGHALPKLIATDGGPLAHPLSDYVEWVSQLIAADDLPFTPQMLAALDRARPFLAMLLGADSAYCWPDAAPPLPQIVETAALARAPISLTTRLAAGKVVVVGLPSRVNGATELFVSGDGQKIFSASLFLHDGTEDQSVLRVEQQRGAQGELLHQAMPAGGRTVFLSGSGDDLRVEDELPERPLARWMRLIFNSEAKISIARNGNQVSIALGSRKLWQLSARGAKFLQGQDQNEVLLAAPAGTSQRVNWALKRVLKDVSKGQKPVSLELPF